MIHPFLSILTIDLLTSLTATFYERFPPITAAMMPVAPSIGGGFG
jgi:hypothetical protein